MLDAPELLAAARTLRAHGTPFVIATVVRVRGSSYRRPGARMILTEQARIAGSVSGGCLEGNLVRTGFWRTRNGPAIVTFDSSDPEDPEAVLGCGGVVDILLERSGDDDALAIADRVIGAGRRATLVTTLAGPDLGKHRLAESKSDDELVETLVPPLALFVFGTGLDAVPVVEAAGRLGWRVHVWGRPEMAARFPGAEMLPADLDAVRARIESSDRAAALVMSHDGRRDKAALAMLLRSRATYIGVLGPRHRTDGFALALDERVHAPVGLDLGAETPAEIAVAVIAEVLAATRGTTAARLRTRPTIHR